MIKAVFCFSSEAKSQLLSGQRTHHAAVRAGFRAREAGLGGAVPELHGGARDASYPASSCWKEAAGPVEALHSCSRNRRPRHGNTEKQQ